MKIQGPAIDLAAGAAKTRSYHRTESLQVITPVEPTQGRGPSVLPNFSQLAQLQQPAHEPDPIDSADFSLSDPEKLKLTLIERMLELLTGKDFHFILPEDLTKGAASGTAKGEDSRQAPTHTAALRAAAQPSFGAIYRKSESWAETESMSFSAKGVVHTSDGRSIAIDVSLSLSRSFIAANYQELRLGTAAKDPLVINLDAPSAALTQTKFSFDLDADGTADQISFVGAGSGFLALDKNGDGVANDGGEFFGTVSGDGFADLAAYGGDRNGWIDGNDPVFERLRIWSRAEDGSFTLIALGQRGIGAIYLGSVASNDSPNDETTNQNNGTIRRTGVFLRQDGTAGTVQHVDLSL